MGKPISNPSLNGTDWLARRLAVVCKWLGNTQAVALRHYIDVTDDDFGRALEVTEVGDPKAA